ncbi:unnamed protein product [Dibothriocephalus latus]|uniref:Uncharacterized protein n=1 Tax=Dibothriocephalus latus TaxID=60516 RepID=A0A3P7LSI2_DIBLA|nr:unnamed protein product [Dibothriocephalus latus]
MITELIKDYDQLVSGCFTQNRQLDEEVKRTSAKVALLAVSEKNQALERVQSLERQLHANSRVLKLEAQLQEKVNERQQASSPDNQLSTQMAGLQLNPAEGDRSQEVSGQSA